MQMKERELRGVLANAIAVEGDAQFDGARVLGGDTACNAGEPDHTHGFRRRAAIGAGNARNCDREIRIEAFARAEGHRPCTFGTDRTVIFENVRAHAE